MVQVSPPAVQRVLSEPQNGATVPLAVGKTLEVRLLSRPSTGYAWEVLRAPPDLLVTRRSATAAQPGPQPFGPTRAQAFDVEARGGPGRTLPFVLAYRPPGRKLAFGRVWRVRLHIEPAAPTTASQTPRRG